MPNSGSFASEMTHAAAVNPSHYKSGGLEAISVVEAFKLNFHLGSAVYYILRCGKKPDADPILDLKKARWYIDREIANLEAKNA